MRIEGKRWELDIDNIWLLMIFICIIVAIMFGTLLKSSEQELKLKTEQEKTKQYELQLQIEQQHNINKEVN